MGFTGFYWVLLGFTGFYWVLVGFSGFYWVLLGFTGFYWVLLGFRGFDWTVRGSNWVLPSFVALYRVFSERRARTGPSRCRLTNKTDGVVHLFPKTPKPPLHLLP